MGASQLRRGKWLGSEWSYEAQMTCSAHAQESGTSTSSCHLRRGPRRVLGSGARAPEREIDFGSGRRRGAQYRTRHRQRSAPPDQGPRTFYRIRP